MAKANGIMEKPLYGMDGIFPFPEKGIAEAKKSR